MSNGTSKPRRAMQLGSAFVAVFALVATITALASAQTTTSVEITEEFCINRSLGGPITYPHDNTGDGIPDLCSLPRTKRATAARQLAMERMASELALLFGHLYAQECLTVSETFGEPAAERSDECAAPRLADARGAVIPPVPATPLPEAILDSRFYSGPVVTGPSFCINHSFGGPRTYPIDNTGDGIADLCSLPGTRRAAVARQNALERMAVDLKPRFDVVFAEECLRVPETLGEPAAEAEDECAVYRAGGTPLPTPGDPTTPGTPGDPGTGTTPDDGTQLPYVPSPIRPSATQPPTYHDRAAQNVVLIPGNQQIEVSWAVPDEDDSTVFKYLVQWRPCPANAQGRPICEGWSTTRQHDAGTNTSYTIPNLTNFLTHEIRILAQRGTNDRYTPTLSATPGWSAPPTWPARNALTNPVYGRVVVDWEAPTPDRLGINHYIIQWDTNSQFADNNSTFPRDCARDTTCNEHQTTSTETSETTYPINGLTNGTYYVRVQGVTSNGPGVWSLNQRITLASTRLDPGQPTGLTLTTTGTNANQLSVTWTPPATTAADPAPTHYLVQWRNIDLGQAFSSTERQRTIDLANLDAATTSVDSTENTVTTIFTPVSPRNEYEVRVQAINVDTPGRWSQAVRHEIGKAQPPTGITQNPGDGDLTISWNQPAGVPAVTSYFLQWGTSCSNSAFSTARQRTVQSTSTTVSDTIPNLTNNQRYYIRIQSINGLGSGDWSSCIIGEPGTLDAPTGVTLADSDTDPRVLTVGWSYSRAGDDVNKPHLSGFKIRYRRDGSTSWSATGNLRLTVELKDQSSPYTYDLKNLTPGYEYEVQVLAQNSYGDGAWTSSSTDIPGTQFIPSSVSVTENDDGTTGNIRSLNVSWSAPTASANITGYRVQYRRSGSTSWSTSSSSLTATDSSHTITNLSTGLEYEVRVVARTASNGDGPGSDLDSGQQPVPSATPGQTFIPTSVTMVRTTTNSVDQLRISWTHSHSYPTTGSITYSVQYRTCATPASTCGGWRNASAGTDTMYDIPVNNLLDNTYYQARVRANGSAIGGNSLYSTESSRWLVEIADTNSPQTPNDKTDDQITVTELTS